MTETQENQQEFQHGYFLSDLLMLLYSYPYFIIFHTSCKHNSFKIPNFISFVKFQQFYFLAIYSHLKLLNLNKRHQELIFMK